MLFIFAAALQCYECEGGPCKNGDTGTLKTCDHGEKSCLYGKVKRKYCWLQFFLDSNYFKILEHIMK